MPPLWSVHCPSSIHKNHETSCSSVKAAGHQIDHLFGRLAHHGPVERNAELSCLNDSSPFREFRFYDELSQVSSNPSHNNGIFRLSHRLPGNDPSFAEGQSQKGKERMSKCSKSPSGYGERAGQTIRPLDLYHSSCLSRPPPLPPLAGRQKQSPCSSGFIRLPGSAFSPGIRGADMVEGQFRCMEWEEPHIRISGSHNRNRRIPQGLGGLLHGGCYGRSVVPRRISATDQLSRAPSRSLCNKDLCKIQSSNESSPTDGQRFCGPLHQQNGGNKIISPSSSSHRSMGMVLTTQNSSRGPVSPRCLKYKGRQGVQGHVRSSRLEIRPISIYKVKSVVRAPRGGPVRISSVHPASSLLQLETRPSGRSCGCFLPRLQLGKGVRIPPFCTHRQVPQKDSRSAGFLFSSSSTCVASSALVPLTPRDVCCSSSSPSSVSGLGNSSGGSTPLSNLQLAGWLLSSNPTLRRKFQKGLKTSWLQPGGREPHQPIRQLGESGMAGAVNGKLIQFMPQ